MDRCLCGESQIQTVSYMYFNLVERLIDNLRFIFADPAKVAEEGGGGGGSGLIARSCNIRKCILKSMFPENSENCLHQNAFE